MDNFKVVLAKKETVYGTDAVPTGAANAILTRNFSAKPVETDQIKRELDLPVFGAQQTLRTNERQRIGFEVELAGSGTAGTAAAWHELLEACGMVAPTITAGVKASQGFATPYVAQSSLSAYHYIADQLRKMVGARGTFALNFAAGALPFMKLDYLGLIPAAAPFSTAAPSASTLTRWKQPVEVNTANTSFMLDGYAAPLRSLQLSANVDVKIRNLVGSRYINRGNHALGGQIVIEAPAMTSIDYIARLRGNALVPMSLIHGTTPGNIVELATSSLDILDITESDEDSKLMWTIDVAVATSAAVNDFAIISR